MTQNRSTAVMQRRIEAHDSLDDFPTQPWATRAVCEALVAQALIDPQMVAREPAANRGFMVRPLQEFFSSVEGADVFDYGAGFPVVDYLFGADPAPVDWTFCNPPFRLAQQFIDRALRTSRIGVAMIVRSAFTEGVDRHATLYQVRPPSFIFQHVERVPMVKGRCDPKASTATSYCWLVWRVADGTAADTRFRWLGPCRKRLEKTTDYLPAPSAAEGLFA